MKYSYVLKSEYVLARVTLDIGTRRVRFSRQLRAVGARILWALAETYAVRPGCLRAASPHAWHQKHVVAHVIFLDAGVAEERAHVYSTLDIAGGDERWHNGFVSRSREPAHFGLERGVDLRRAARSAK